MMLVEWILSHGMEQSDFLVLLRSQRADRVISHRVIELDFSEDILGSEFRVRGDLLHLRLVFEPIRLLRVYVFDKASHPVIVSIVLILLWRKWLLQDVLIALPKALHRDICLGVKNELV